MFSLSQHHSYNAFYFFICASVLKMFLRNDFCREPRKNCCEISLRLPGQRGAGAGQIKAPRPKGVDAKHDWLG
jgi:hypothetical protein